MFPLRTVSVQSLTVAEESVRISPPGWENETFAHPAARARRGRRRARRFIGVEGVEGVERVERVEGV